MEFYTTPEDKLNQGLLKAIREEGSQTRLGKVIEASQAAISGWLRGDVPPKKALVISELYGIPVRDLVPALWRRIERLRKRRKD